MKYINQDFKDLSQIQFISHSGEESGKSRYKFRENFQVISEDLVFDLPFHGHVAPSDGGLLTLMHKDDSHKNEVVLKRRTIRCHAAGCPKDNFVWENYANGIPVLRNGHLIPDGWWAKGIARGKERFHEFNRLLVDELSLIDKTAGINNKGTNRQIDEIIKKRFANNLPGWSREKLHNVIWHMLKSAEALREYHVIISPPPGTDWKSKEDQKAVREAAKKLFVKIGGWGGFWAVHHARIRDKFNDPNDPAFLGYAREDDAEGFHFHVVGYGFFNFKEWEGSGWIVRNKGKVENVGGLISYILNHASVISNRQVEQKVNSLSCDNADRVISQQSNINLSESNLYYQSNEDSGKNEADDFFNDFKAPEKQVENSISVFKGKKKPVRHAFKIYWFSGCLHESKFKITKPLETCPHTEHPIDQHVVKAVEVWKREYVVPDAEQIKAMWRQIESLLSPDVWEFEASLEILNNIKLADAGASKVWIEEKISEQDYEKHLKRIVTPIEKLLDIKVSARDERNFDRAFELKEFAEIEIKRDPMKGWFLLDLNDAKVFAREKWKSRQYG